MKPHIFLLFSFLSACSSFKVDLGAATDYFPEAYWLKQGIVNKYHYHFDQGEGYDPSTDIHYRSYQLIGEDQLRVCRYDPAMRLVQENMYQFEDEQMQLLAETHYLRSDTLQTDIIQDIFANWEVQQDTLQTKRHFVSGTVQETFQYQRSVQDTVLFSQRKAKTISKEIHTSNYFPDQDPQEYQGHMRSTYVQGIGLYSYDLIYASGKGKLELIEQIPLESFEKLAQHAVKRVAYINPDDTLDPESDFRPCEGEQRIVDYYNGEPDARIVGGKRALWDILDQYLDQEKLFQESGYLTFRFIINCEGETGWFVIEEADLDYQRITFRNETREHLLKILQTYPQWQATEIRGDIRDAYAYITFKLDHGQIIELLP